MEFREWLQKECFYWYLLDEEQVDDYFSQWFDRPSFMDLLEEVEQGNVSTVCLKDICSFAWVTCVPHKSILSRRSTIIE